MKILHKDLQHGKVKVRIEEDEDLWNLDQVIEPGDYLSGKTERKMKLGADGKKVERKLIFAEIEAEKISYDPGTATLRVNGTIRQGPEEVSKGSYHSFTLQTGSKVTIQKTTWGSHHLQKIKDATQPAKKVLLVLVDRTDARLGVLTRNGYKEITTLNGEVEKKDMDARTEDDFYGRVAGIVESYADRYSATTIVVASPSFWKEYVVEKLSDKHSSNVIGATVSSTEPNAFNELLKRPELKAALQHDRTSRELQEIERFMEALRNNKACYGVTDCKRKLQLGAIEKLLISENYLKEKRQEGTYRNIGNIMKAVEDMDGSILFISGNEPMQKVDGLGGIIGILRWKA